MSKTLKSLGLAAFAAVLVLAPLSAQAGHTTSGQQGEKWQQKRCQKLEARENWQFSRFDQTRSTRLNRLQQIINHQNQLGCPTEGNIVQTLVDNGNFKTLVAAVTAAGLADDLSAPGTLTVFAPTDQAFAKLPAGTVEALLGNIPALTNILLYHVVGAEVPAATAKTLTSATMLNTDQVNIKVEGGKLYVNNSQVILYDIQTDNGIIHVLDTVLIPS